MKYMRFKFLLTFTVIALCQSKKYQGKPINISRKVKDLKDQSKKIQLKLMTKTQGGITLTFLELHTSGVTGP